ncbi:hypothetical protein GFO_2985 [Christiangramia forsetii KT0803]|uniref:Uncharacterized protein n=1 Tax=Christiangramia forsetii (strain DSM 17595 / CGMCC 1.15422 / KT0803) TaxID=411154 RepID=A0M5N7_CHRFK|nr:hypothetical protein GFO_2985 [Christiangramia forsetii KT0803]
MFISNSAVVPSGPPNYSSGPTADTIRMSYYNGLCTDKL